MKFLDAHTHVHFPAYDADRDAVVTRARAAGVSMILVGTQMSTSRAGVLMAEANPQDMWATVGFHPAHCVAAAAMQCKHVVAEKNEQDKKKMCPHCEASAKQWHHDLNEQIAAEPEIFDAVALKELARNPSVIAIGECGLDYGSGDHVLTNQAEKDKQKEAFAAHIEIAREIKKPLMIHCRNAFSDLIEILIEHGYPHETESGVIHFFTGTEEDAKKFIDLGFSFTFGGVVTFPPRKNKTEGDYDAVIRSIPIDRILSETDAPYVAPMPYRGQRNEPAYVVETVKRLAELKGVSTDEMVATIATNAHRIFGI